MSQSFLVDRPQSQQVLSTRWVPRESTRVQADSLKKGDPGLDVGEWARSANSTTNEVAQESQVISNGNANIEGPQVNFQNEISDPDECAKVSNATAVREAEKTDFSLKTKDEK